MPSIATSTVRVSDSGSLLHSPTVPFTAWYGYAFASPFSYASRACPVISSRASTSAPEAASSRAVPAGSGLSAPTLWLTTVRSPPGWDLSPSSAPKRFSHTRTGSSSAATAEAERRHSAPASSTGTNRPNHGRKVSTRLPMFLNPSGIRACSSMSRPSSSASAVSTGPRFQGPGPETMRTARRMPARQAPEPPPPRRPASLSPASAVSRASAATVSWVSCWGVVVIVWRLPVDRTGVARDRSGSSSGRAESRRRRPPGRQARSLGYGRLPFVLVRCGTCPQSRQGGVAGTYAVFDMPTICTDS